MQDHKNDRKIKNEYNKKSKKRKKKTKEKNSAGCILYSWRGDEKKKLCFLIVRKKYSREFKDMIHSLQGLNGELKGEALNLNNMQLRQNEWKALEECRNMNQLQERIGFSIGWLKVNKIKTGNMELHKCQNLYKDIIRKFSEKKNFEEPLPMLSFPKGSRESGEDIVACAEREVMEETNYRIKISDHKFNVSYHSNILYLVQVDNNDMEQMEVKEVKDNDEVEALQWMR